jgi:hypothetical protein
VSARRVALNDIIRRAERSRRRGAFNEARAPHVGKLPRPLRLSFQENVPMFSLETNVVSEKGTLRFRNCRTLAWVLQRLRQEPHHMADDGGDQGLRDAFSTSAKRADAKGGPHVRKKDDQSMVPSSSMATARAHSG